MDTLIELLLTVACIVLAATLLSVLAELDQTLTEAARLRLFVDTWRDAAARPKEAE